MKPAPARPGKEKEQANVHLPVHLPLIRATSLDAAVDLARGCPILRHGGTVEVGELTNHDDQFDAWLDRQVTS
jgi:hypothetical protein